MSKEINLTKGKVAIVDDEDFEWLSKYNWYLNCKGYATRSGLVKDGVRKGKTIFMHREILDIPQGLFGDHIDMNPLNNQRSNLRIVNKQQNNANRTTRKDSSKKYKGVWLNPDGNVYMGRLTLNGKRYYSKRFKDIKLAALAYNDLAIKHFGEHARLNEVSL